MQTSSAVCAPAALPAFALENPQFWLAGIGENEASEFSGIPVRTLQGHRCAGTGPAFLKSGARSVHYRRIDILLWQESRRATSVRDAQGVAA